MTQPFMPASMEKLLGLLSVPADARKFLNAEIAQDLVAGTLLPPPAPVFPPAGHLLEKKQKSQPRGNVYNLMDALRASIKSRSA